MDIYEVTVGRFRRFVDAGYGTQAKPPADGSGENPHLAESGWKSTWKQYLQADTAALKAALMVDASCTWSNDPADKEDFPINNVSWLTAFAFCIWDGGRLPTYAEWDYVARGGSEQRKLPWSNPPDAATCDCSYANYNACGGVFTKKVGSHSPLGDGRWGQADMVGNTGEMMRDVGWTSLPYPCNDCAALGDFGAYKDVVLSAKSNQDGCELMSPSVYPGPFTVSYWSAYKQNGIRCVRNP